MSVRHSSSGPHHHSGICPWLVFILLLLLLSARVSAQVVGATLSGIVTDSSGAVVPAAQVAIQNMATGVKTVAKANSSGFYTVPNLVPGNYEVAISAPGFAALVRTGITLTVGAEQVLNVTLTVGQATQTVEVTGSAPVVELSSSAIGSVIGSNSVVELPLNGRDWTKLAALSPGVTNLTNQSSVAIARAVRGFGSELSISGTRPQMNNYRVDGISVVDYSGGAPGSLLGIALGVDAIGQFSVLTSNYSAEYGRSAGGVVNAITRSGTNSLHGTAYGFLRDEGLDARNHFDKAIPSFHKAQFGGSAGGPIQKDKTFFFADYEGLRESLGVTVTDNVPSPAARTGKLSSGTVIVDPKIMPYLAFYPLPNNGLLGAGDTGQFVIPETTNTSENFLTTRIDRKFSEKDSLFGSYMYDHTIQTLPDAFDNWTLGNKTVRQMVALEETHVFNPSLVNSIRGGFSRIVALADTPISATNPLSLDTSLGALPGATAPGIQVTGLTLVRAGFGSLGLPYNWWNSFQLYDDAFWTKGVHSIRFGFAFERMQHNMFNSTVPTGIFSFATLANFLTNKPSTFIAQVASTITERGARQSLFGGYLQDDWRLRPNVTVNLGLRYEAVTVPTEVQNRLGNLPTLTSAAPRLGSPYFQNPSLRNFEPRVGFAWDPFRSGTTSVRGAFGIYDILPLNEEFWAQEVQSAPYAQLLGSSSLPQGSFPTQAFTIESANPAGSSFQAYIPFNPPRNYVLIWNLSVERQLGSSVGVFVGYVGNRGVHMPDRDDDANMVLPVQTTSAGLLWPSPVGSGTLLNPNVGDIRSIQWIGHSYYDAFEAQVTKRMSHGFQIQGSYTWGKSIDTGSSGSPVADPFANSIASPFWFCNVCRRGLSDFNVSQVVTVNYIWDIPNPKSWGVVASHVLGGWEVGGIFAAQTGLPFTPLISGDPLGLKSQSLTAYPSRLGGPGCSSAVNPGNPLAYINLSCFTVPMATPAIAALCTPYSTVPGSCSNLLGNVHRNSVIGPGLENWDFSLFKNNYVPKVSESFNAQFRAEFYNILNRTNLAFPASALFNQTGAPVGGAGQITTTSTTSRQIQLALKLIW